MADTIVEHLPPNTTMFPEVVAILLKKQYESKHGCKLEFQFVRIDVGGVFDSVWKKVD